MEGAPLVQDSTLSSLMKTVCWNRFVAHKISHLSQKFLSQSAQTALTESLKIQETARAVSLMPEQPKSTKKENAKRDAHLKLGSQVIAAKEQVLGMLLPDHGQRKDLETLRAETMEMLDQTPPIKFECTYNQFLLSEIPEAELHNQSHTVQESEYACGFRNRHETHLYRLTCFKDCRVTFFDVSHEGWLKHQSERAEYFYKPKLINRITAGICPDLDMQKKIEFQILQPHLVTLSVLRLGVPFESPTRTEFQLFYKGRCVYSKNKDTPDGHRPSKFVDFHFLFQRTQELLFRVGSEYILLKLGTMKVILRLEEQHPFEEEPEEIEELCQELQRYEQEYFYHDYVEPDPTAYGFAEGESVNISDLDIDKNHSVEALCDSDAGVFVKAVDSPHNKILIVGGLYQIKVSEAARYPCVHGQYVIWHRINLKERTQHRLGPVTDSEIGEAGTKVDLEASYNHEAIVNWSHGYISLRWKSVYIHIYDGFRGEIPYSKGEELINTIRSCTGKKEKITRDFFSAFRVRNTKQDLLLCQDNRTESKNAGISRQLIVQSIHPWVCLGAVPIQIMGSHWAPHTLTAEVLENASPHLKLIIKISSV